MHSALPVARCVKSPTREEGTYTVATELAGIVTFSDNTPFFLLQPLRIVPFTELNSPSANSKSSTT